MLKDTVLIGHGPDTYALEFPQHDYVGKLNSFRSHRMIVDKPHNMYLQIGINTGLISLLAVITLFAVYFFRSLAIFWKSNYNNWYERAGLGMFSSFMAYGIAGFFNDSIISVAPVFWMLLGIGIMIELKIKSHKSY